MVICGGLLDFNVSLIQAILALIMFELEHDNAILRFLKKVKIYPFSFWNLKPIGNLPMGILDTPTAL